MIDRVELVRVGGSRNTVSQSRAAIRSVIAALTWAFRLSHTTTIGGDELAYLRIHRNRARLVLFACRKLLADREADDKDIMAVVTSLRDQL